jgi:hypothetical protein
MRLGGGGPCRHPKFSRAKGPSTALQVTIPPGPPNGLRLSGARKGVRCSRRLDGLAVNVFAIRDPNDEHEQLIVGD